MADYIFSELGLEVPYDSGTIYDVQTSTPIRFSKRFFAQHPVLHPPIHQDRDSIDEAGRSFAEAGGDLRR